MLALDPNETFEVSLASDKNKPEAERTKFRFRYLTIRQWRETAWLDDTAKVRAAGTEKTMDALLAAIKRNLVGWNVEGVPFDADMLDDVSTLTEAWELYWLARRQSRLEVTEKNASASPSAIPTVGSAQGADLDAPAPTP